MPFRASKPTWRGSASTSSDQGAGPQAECEVRRNAVRTIRDQKDYKPGGGYFYEYNLENLPWGEFSLDSMLSQIYANAPT